MDKKPFLEINMLDLRDHHIEELKKFHKSYFDVDSILSSASELKYMGELKNVIVTEFANPSPDFVKYLGKQVYDGLFMPKILDQFTTLVKRTINSYINDMIYDRLKAAIKNEDTDEQPEAQTHEPSLIVEKNKIVTTEIELEAFYIVKSILRSKLPVERISYRDTQTYFAVLIDNNNRKLVCRLYLNSPTKKRLVLIDENKKEIVYKLSSLDEIYTYSQELINAIDKHM